MRLGFFVLFSVMPNLEVLDVVVNVPLLVHGLHPQVLLGLVHTLNVIIIPTQVIVIRFEHYAQKEAKDSLETYF